MSIYKAYQTPVKWLRGFFFLMVSLICTLEIFSITCYATDSKTVFSKNIYHQHTGSSGGGGCYSILRSGTTTVEVPCGGSMVYFPAQDESKCSRCAASYSGDQSHRGCWHSETHTTTYTYYDLGCNKSSDTLLGTVTVEQSTTQWTKSLQLTASFEAAGDMYVAEKPYIWNGGEATLQNVYEVFANGDYTLELQADANADTKAATVVVPIRNIDVTAPVIHSHTLEPATDWTKDGVLVTVTEISDLQPDGSEGCGLHENPYSYDNGESWTADNTHFYTENGVYTILVRDCLENCSSYEVSFSNVDSTPPSITTLDYDDTKNIKATQLSVSANDLQPDGSQGCGLHEKPYSFDGGQTWGESAVLPVNVNGKIVVAVRDKLENIVCREVDITNVDCYGPSINYNMVSDSWTNQDVRLYLHAQDKNADGSDGIGLADNWLSLDGGKSWMNAEVLVYENNQDVNILTRDKNENVSHTDISIRQIDKEPPWVSLRMEVIGEGKDMQVVLTAYGGDDYSGLPEDAYSWNKGASYGKEQTFAVTENGLYQVRVRDKAGNWDCDNIEVDVFEEEIPQIPVIREYTPDDTKEETTPEKETEEETLEPVIIRAKKVKEEPMTQEVDTITNEGWGMKEWLCFLLFLLMIGMLLLLFLFMLLRTIAVFAEDEKGNMQFIGLQWIYHRDERYEVHFADVLIEKCVTTHFTLRPGPLFVLLHKDEQISCLFPEDICIVLPIKKEMDFSLL